MGSLSELDTVDLVARVRDGDQDAWVALTDRYTSMLWSVARSMRLSSVDAADAVQTTWLRLVERLDSLREPERLGGWLATTMRRECLAILRRRERVQVGTAQWWESIAAGGDPLDEALVRQERDAALWKAFHALQPRCQALLRVLMADPPPHYAEVAAALDIPVGSIGPTRQRCLNSLRRILGADASPTPRVNS
jgi:RNA polymerase sigma factor (sigma-70 family)